MNCNRAVKQAISLIGIATLIGIGINAVRTDSIAWLSQELEFADSLSFSESQVLSAISLAQAKELFDQGVIFIDAREPEYFNEGHVPGAWNFSSVLELAFSLDTLQGKTEPLVTYCGEAGCGSSEDLAYTLSEMGFEQIYIFVGGWQLWVDSRYPVAKDGK